MAGLRGDVQATVTDRPWWMWMWICACACICICICICKCWARRIPAGPQCACGPGCQTLASTQPTSALLCSVLRCSALRCSCVAAPRLPSPALSCPALSALLRTIVNPSWAALCAAAWRPNRYRRPIGPRDRCIPPAGRSSSLHRVMTSCCATVRPKARSLPRLSQGRLMRAETRAGRRRRLSPQQPKHQTPARRRRDARPTR